MQKTAEARCQRLVDLLTKRTGIQWTLGYLGNVYADGTDDRRWYAFAAHPGRPGTDADRIGGFRDLADLIPWLQGAVSLTTVLAQPR